MVNHPNRSKRSAFVKAFEDAGVIRNFQEDARREAENGRCSAARMLMALDILSEAEAEIARLNDLLDGAEKQIDHLHPKGMRMASVSYVHLGALSDALSDMIEIADDRARHASIALNEAVLYSPNEQQVRDKAARLLVRLNEKINRSGGIVKKRG